MLDIYKLASIIDRTFHQLFYDNEPYNGESEYYIYRVYPNNMLICYRQRDEKYYQLTWTVDDDNVVTFSDKSEWIEIKMEAIPTGEVGARSTVPFVKNIQSRGREQRIFSGAESRMTEDGNGMEGLGIVVESRTLLFTDSNGRNVYEEIAREAVQNYDFSRGDVISAFNHNFEKILGRTSANTLAITKDNTGMRYSIPSLPNTSYGNDLKEQLSRGDVKGSSFVFTIAEGGETWTEIEGGMLRTITQFDEVFEVGPVVFPAYVDTTAAKRSLEGRTTNELEIKQIQTVDFQTELRSRRLRLEKLKTF
jgi:HK97 family phage prohead protease